MDHTFAFIHILLLALAFHSGESVKCYVCKSSTDARCADPIQAEGLAPLDCTSSIATQAATAFNTISKKISDIGAQFGIDTKAPVIDSQLVCSKFTYEAENTKVTVRGCAFPPTDTVDTCKTIKDLTGSDTTKVTFCGTCNTDLCNSATVPSSGFLLLLLPLFGLLLAVS